MIITITDDERIDTVINSWECLLEDNESFLFDDGDFNQDLFRETMYMTWELFSQRIDFDAPDDNYYLPVDLARILGLIMVYERQYQVEDRRDGGDIGLSTLLAHCLWEAIYFRKTFSRSDPLIKSKKLINEILYELTYNLETGELHVQSGLNPDVQHYRYDGSTETMEPIKLNTIEPIIVTDISRWWDLG